MITIDGIRDSTSENIWEALSIFRAECSIRTIRLLPFRESQIIIFGDDLLLSCTWTSREKGMVCDVREEAAAVGTREVCDRGKTNGSTSGNI